MDNLKEILASVFQMKAADITDDITMTDVERWDSLTHMKLIVALEETYGIEIGAEQIMTMKSVQVIKQIVFEKAAA